MISPLQVLFYFAVTLAPAGSHHVIVSSGSEVYKWDKGDSLDDDATWVYDSAAVDPQVVLDNNNLVPANLDHARNETGRALKKEDGCFTLLFDPAHELQKTSEGYVYIVRPGSVNEKFYSFKFL